MIQRRSTYLNYHTVAGRDGCSQRRDDGVEPRVARRPDHDQSGAQSSRRIVLAVSDGILFAVFFCEVERVVEMTDRIHRQIVFDLDVGAGRLRIFRQSGADAAGLVAQAGMETLELVLAVTDVLSSTVNYGILEPLNGDSAWRRRHPVACEECLTLGASVRQFGP